MPDTVENLEEKKRRRLTEEFTGLTFEEATPMSLGFDPRVVNEASDDIKKKLRKDFKNER